MVYDIIIAGGGASALACAIATGKRGLKTAVLERNARVGKKILTTGNGRCNFTNLNMTVQNYHGDNIQMIEEIMDFYTPDRIIQFFHSIGLIHRKKEGRVYPYSNQAASVLNSLKNAIAFYNVDEFCEFTVVNAYKKGALFYIKNQHGDILNAYNLVVATGGKAAEGSAAGFEILSGFGHGMIKTYPALVQLKTAGDFAKSLKGIKFIGKVKVYCDGILSAEEEGEILFTEYGISGIAVMQLSYLYSQCEKMAVELDFLGDMSFEDTLTFLFARRAFFKNSNFTVEALLCGVLNKNLGYRLLKLAGIEKLSYKIADLTDKQLKSLAKRLKGTRLDIIGHNGFANAQVSGGGIALDDFDKNTLQSNIVKGLYAAGEVLDVFGDCGGYNLHWAWASGLCVGDNAVRERIC